MSSHLLPKLIRLEEAADYFGVTMQTIYNWINSGKLEAVRVGDKLLRIPHRSLSSIQKRLNKRQRPLANDSRKRSRHSYARG